MLKTLSTRDKRAMLLMAVGAAAICGYFWALEPMLERYGQLQRQRAALQKSLDTVLALSSPADQPRLRTITQWVPVYEMPKTAAEQGILLRDEITQQLARSGIQARSLQLRESRTGQVQDGYRVVLLECQGRCPVPSMMQFIERLKENPYFVGVEKLVLKADTRDRNTVTFQLIVSTYAKG